MPNPDTWCARLLVYFILFFIGAGIGWLAGLSVSPVVSIIITSVTGSVAAVVAALSGIRSAVDNPGEANRYELFRTRVLTDARPIALVIAGIIAGSYVGVMARTHQWLAPDLSSEIVKWTSAGLPKEEVARGLFQSQFHINPQTPATVSVVSGTAMSGVLFSVGNDECSSLRGKDGNDLRRELATATNVQLRQLPEIVEDTDVLKQIVDNVLCAEQ